MADTSIAICGEPLSEPVHWVGRQWAVTSYGVEKRDGTYVIEKGRLREAIGNWSWEKHMAEKEWVDLPDFMDAIEEARRLFGKG